MEATIPKSWLLVAVEDLASPAPNSLIGNTFGSMLKAAEYQATGVPILRGENLAGPGRFNSVATVFVSEEKAQQLSKQTALPDDVVFTQQGTNRHVGIIPKDCPHRRWVVSQSQMRLRVDREKVDPLYVYYYFTQGAVKERLQSLAVVKGVHHINLGSTAEFPFVLPPVEDQRRILGVIGSLDDKIDLNHRMNETLEAIARSLFRSWFVDFDPVRAKQEGRQPPGLDAATAALFPGSFEDSPLGPIPAGWRVTTLGEFCEQITDGAHLSPASVDDGLPMASVKDLTNWGIDLSACRRISPEDYQKLVSSGCQPKRGDVLLAKDGAYCLDTACEFQQDDKIVLLSSVAILRPRSSDTSVFLHLWLGLDATKNYLKEGFRSGSAIPRVVLRDLKRARLITPSPDLIERFDRAVKPLRRRVRLNVESSVTLAALRDSLLPKLLSGEIRVGNLETSVQ